MFVDEVRIHITAGRGGDGSCSFRREKFVPRGGPDGGDGGHGGNVVFEASPRMTTLLDLRYQKHYEAEVGRQGGAANCSGRSGKDVVVAAVATIRPAARHELFAPKTACAVAAAAGVDTDTDFIDKHRRTVSA